MSAEYRIEFTIQRKAADAADDDFTDIGFGSSGAWSDLTSATHWIDSGVSNYEWETEPGMPDPEEIRAEIEGRS